LVIFLALTIGAIAVVIALRWIGQRTELATIRVVVASRDLPFGTQLQTNMLEVIDWPATAMLKDPVSDPKLIDKRVINAPMMRGEPVLSAKLAPQGEKGGLSAMLHEGSRAVTVKVNEIVGVAGFALPGNFVDVMVHATGSKEQPVSKIVLERILVLALAQDASTSETKPRVVNAVTLEVTPQQAEKIDFARSVGTLSLVLRSQVDMGRVGTTGVHMADLLQSIETPLPALPTSPVKSTLKPLVSRPATTKPADHYEVIRGNKRTLE
jgi:pilus assembly protein CpaB